PPCRKLSSSSRCRHPPFASARSSTQPMISSRSARPARGSTPRAHQVCNVSARPSGVSAILVFGGGLVTLCQGSLDRALQRSVVGQYSLSVGVDVACLRCF